MKKRKILFLVAQGIAISNILGLPATVLLVQLNLLTKQMIEFLPPLVMFSVVSYLWIVFHLLFANEEQNNVINKKTLRDKFETNNF